MDAKLHLKKSIPFVWCITHLGDIFYSHISFPWLLFFKSLCKGFKQNICQSILNHDEHLFKNVNAMMKCLFLVKHHEVFPEHISVCVQHPISWSVCIRPKVKGMMIVSQCLRFNELQCLNILLQLMLWSTCFFFLLFWCDRPILTHENCNLVLQFI